MTAAHSTLKPSAAHRWVRCPGSVVAEDKYPDIAGPHAERGREIHRAAAELVDLGRRGVSWETPGEINGQAVDVGDLEPAEIAAAHIYAANVVGALRAAGIFGGPSMGLEQQISLNRIWPGTVGTPDAWLYDAKTQHLIVWDLKTGYGIIEAVGNWQMICYAVGLLDTGRFLPEKITLRIVQPRAPHPDGPIRSWTLDIDTLGKHKQVLQDAAAEAFSHAPSFRPGPHCRYCRARADCGPFARGALDYAEFGAGTSVPQPASPEIIAMELELLEDAAEVISYRLGELRSVAEKSIREGTVIPGWRIASTAGRMKWIQPLADVLRLGDALGIDLRKDDVVTPTQAVAAGVPREVVDAYSSRAAGKTKIVRDTGSTDRAQEIFGGKL